MGGFGGYPMPQRAGVSILNLEGIPLELKKLIQWVGWQIEKDENGNPTKVPYFSRTQRKASVSDSKDFSGFLFTVEAVKSGFHKGIGFVFTEHDQYCGIDFDKCIDPETKEIKSWILEKLKNLNSYTEYSQSGLGLHIILKAKIPEHIKAGNKTGRKDIETGIEIYDCGRFFCMTGDRLDDYPEIVEERQAEFEQFCSEIFGKPKPVQKPSGKEPFTSNLSDSEIISIIRKSKQGAKFSKLFDHGDCSDYLKSDGTPDQSSGDMALVDIFAFYTQDFEQIVSLVKQSALYDDKWDREDYQHRTIRKALSGSGERYNPGSNHTSRAGDPVVEPKQEEKPITPFKLTDYGNAERLVYYHGENIRYCHDLKTWFVWDGTHWKEDNFGEIRRLAKDVVRRIYAEASECSNDDIRKSYLKHIKESESNFKQKAMIELAQSEIEVSILQSQLDSNDYFFNVLNGTIDLETGELLQHKRENLITRLSPVTYDPDVRFELWDNFLNTVTNGNEEIKDFLQQAVGYSLTGDTAEEVLFFVHGEASTGKSTFVEAVKAVMGDYAKTADFESFLKRKEVGGVRNDIANLAGARLVTSIEVDEGKALAEGLIKMITGGDTVRARFLYHEGFDFLPKMKLWLCANHIPKVRHDDTAMWRRILKIPFNHVISKEDRDPQVKKTLKDTSIAGPAILAWAVKGCLLYLERGKLCVPEDITKATEDYRESMDTMKPFIDECCVLGIAKMAKVSDLHNKYIEWSGYHINRKEFGNRMESLNFKKVKQESGLFWMGIGISD